MKDSFECLKLPHLTDEERSRILNKVLCSKSNGEMYITTLYDFAARQVASIGFPPSCIDIESCVHDALLILMKRLAENYIHTDPHSFLLGTIRRLVQCEIREYFPEITAVELDTIQDICSNTTMPDESEESAPKEMEDSPPPKLLPNEETVKKLKADIDKLPKKLRDFGRMVIIERLTRKQIIRIMDISPGYYRKLRQRLRDGLREMGYDV